MRIPRAACQQHRHGARQDGQARQPAVSGLIFHRPLVRGHEGVAQVRIERLDGVVENTKAGELRLFRLIIHVKLEFPARRVQLGLQMLFPFVGIHGLWPAEACFLI